ncbi:MAG TPA: hypothetical protein VGB30_07995 [bacterium]|jgi:hypothetical protein
MADWDFATWMRVGLTWLAIFAVIGGIVSQTSGGASGRGFVEGMWKGVEIFFLVAVAGFVIYGAMLALGMISTTVNSSL